PGYDKDDHTQKFDATAAKAALASSSFAGKPELNGIKFTYSSSARNKTRIEWAQQQGKTTPGTTATPPPRGAPGAFLSFPATKYLLKPYVTGVTDTALDFEIGIMDMTKIAVTKKP